MRLFRRLKSSKKKRIVARRRLLLEPLEARNLMALDLAAISGTAFVDLTGNGLTADDTRINGATVELYRDNGDNSFDAATDTLLGTTTTDASGGYRFASINAGGLLPANTLSADDYFVRQLPAAGLAPPAAALVTLTSANVNGTTVETVDTFDTTEQTVTADTTTPVAGSSLTAVEAIGGERDVLVTLTSPTGQVSVLIDHLSNPDIFAFTSGLNSAGTALIQYDGPDGDESVLTATGLGGVNLSGSNSSAGLLLATRGDAAGGTAELRVYTDAANFSTTTINIPGQASIENIFIPFSDFTIGSGAGATFTSIGALELLIIGATELDATVTVLRSLRPNETISNLENFESSIEIIKLTNGLDANTEATGPNLAVGATATFTYTVRSTGGTSLQNVVVTDDNGTSGTTADDFSPTFVSGDTNSNNILETAETWTYTATRTVTPGQYTNIASVTAVDSLDIEVSDSDPSNHFGVNAGIALVKSTNGQDANTAPGPALPVGSTATFTYIVTNTGNVALATVTVRDDNGTPGTTADDFDATFQSGDTNSNGRLDTTETWTYQATRIVTTGQHTNIGAVSGNPVDSAGSDIAGVPDPTDTDVSNHFGASAGVNVVKSTNGQDANTAPGPSLAVGATATFTYVVTNTGNVPLGSVVVRDDNGTPDAADDFNATLQSGDTNSNGRLDTTETWTYQATRIVTAGQHTNIGTATANPVDTTGADIAGLADVSDSDPSNHLGVAAGINIVKSTNGQDANSAPGPLLVVGATATFTYVVTNTGSTGLATVVVRDDNGTPGNTADDIVPTLQSGDTNSNGRLDTTETWTYQATRTVTAGQYANIGSVTANPVDATGADIAGLADVSDTDASHHLGIVTGVNIVKSTNGQDANTATGPVIAVGGTATFTYVVTNTGTVALGTVVVRDDNGTTGNTADDFSPTFQGGDTNSNSRLDPTETWTYTATRTVTAGQYTNTGRVTANPVDSNGADIANAADVTDTDLSNHFGFTAGIALQKRTNGIDTGAGTGPNAGIGSTATFTYSVTNTGNIPLTNIVITDDNGTAGSPADDFTPTRISGDTDGDNQLDVGETWLYQATHVVTAGAYSNSATVSGSDPNATVLSATDVSAHVGVNRLSKRRFIASGN
ncbi:MAG: beta strand repeat-containing protein [Pirellulaceae bacterium]